MKLNNDNTSELLDDDDSFSSLGECDDTDDDEIEQFLVNFFIK